jgi:3-oxoadipate CoA-transferase alpha subunit
MTVIDKRVASGAQALEGLRDGATLLISGFGDAGMPHHLVNALVEKGTRDLTVVTNNAGVGRTGIGALFAHRQIRKIVCSFPRSADSSAFDEQYARGEVELELVPQGTLSERIRAAGAGVAGFYVKTGVGTELAKGKELREFDGETYVFERPIVADAALIKAHRADRWGNLTYRLSARNFAPVMAAASKLTIVEAAQVVELGEIEAENVMTPSIFVDRVWEIAQ